LNPTENLGEIVKDRVERLMHLEKGPGLKGDVETKVGYRFVETGV